MPLIRHSSFDIRHSTSHAPDSSPPLYREWVGRVTRLAESIRALDATAQGMRLPPAESFTWHGNLFQKLLPQLAKEPFLIVAVTGGTLLVCAVATGAGPVALLVAGLAWALAANLPRRTAR